MFFLMLFYINPLDLWNSPLSIIMKMSHRKLATPLGNNSSLSGFLNLSIFFISLSDLDWITHKFIDLRKKLLWACFGFLCHVLTEITFVHPLIWRQSASMNLLLCLPALQITGACSAPTLIPIRWKKMHSSALLSDFLWSNMFS